MFRAIDRDHMLSRFDLWDYDQVVTHADALLARLEVDMPTPASGGLWPAEWIGVFRRWKDSGFKRLELGTAQLMRAQVGSKIVITGTGTFPAAGYRSWLQLEGDTDTARTYHLYFEAPDQPTTGQPSPFSLRERYPASDTRPVYVLDASGLSELPFSTTPSFAEAAMAEMDDMSFFRDG
jgi:hypothetical protein